MVVSQKIKNRISIWSCNPTPGDISIIGQNYNLKGYMHPNVYSSTIYNSQKCKQPKCSLIDDWIKKMWCVYMYMYICIYIYTHTHTYKGILLSHKKEWNNAICRNMDRPRDYHTKWSKSERERWLPYDITYMWNLTYDTNELLWNCNRLIDIGNRLVVAKGERGWEREGLGVWC